jgi:hypothetical protein
MTTALAARPPNTSRSIRARGTLFPRCFGPFYVSGETARCGAWPSVDVPIIRNARPRGDSDRVRRQRLRSGDTAQLDAQPRARALGTAHNLVRYTGGGHGPGHERQRLQDAITESYLFDLTVPAEDDRAGRFEPPGRWTGGQTPAQEAR